jgi:hypothetical protein
VTVARLLLLLTLESLPRLTLCFKHEEVLITDKTWLRTGSRSAGLHCATSLSALRRRSQTPGLARMTDALDAWARMRGLISLFSLPT